MKAVLLMRQSRCQHGQREGASVDDEKILTVPLTESPI